jgi:hypothetical protein
MPRLIKSTYGFVDPYLYPDAGDTAFEPGDPVSPGVAALRWLGQVKPQWRSYAEGFRTAAEMLGRSVIAETQARTLLQPQEDEVALPLVALWRQYLELTLKALIPELRELSFAPAAPLPYSHNLVQMWEMAEPALTQLTDDEASLAVARSVVMEFAKLDPKGEVFRYPVSMKGVWSLAELPETLDLGHFHETMQGVANFFYGCSAAIDATHDMRNEEASYRAQFADSLGGV